MANTNQSFKITGTVAFSNLVNPHYWDSANNTFVTVDLKKHPEEATRQGLQYAITINNPKIVGMDKNNITPRERAIGKRFRKNKDGVYQLYISRPVFNQSETSKPLDKRQKNVIYYADEATKTRIAAENYGLEIGRDQEVTVGLDTYESANSNTAKYDHIALSLRYVVFQNMKKANFWGGDNSVPSDLSGFKDVDATETQTPAPTASTASTTSTTPTASANSSTTENNNDLFSASNTNNNDPFDLSNTDSDNSTNGQARQNDDPFENSNDGDPVPDVNNDSPF